MTVPSINALPVRTVQKPSPPQGGPSSVAAGERREEDNGNDNGTGRIVTQSTISIRESLRETPVKEQATLQQDRVQEPTDEEVVGGDEVLLADPDRILKTWEKYAASVEKSKPRTYSTLTSNKPVIRPDGTILLRLNTEAQRDHFSRVIKPGLIRFIEETTGDRIPDIIAEVAEAGQNGRKIYTDQDKLDYLMSRNPDLGLLKSRLGLDFDD